MINKENYVNGDNDRTPGTAHWIYEKGNIFPHCSSCGNMQPSESPYCLNCGCAMNLLTKEN